MRESLCRRAVQNEVIKPKAYSLSKNHSKLCDNNLDEFTQLAFSIRLMSMLCFFNNSLKSSSYPSCSSAIWGPWSGYFSWYFFNIDVCRSFQETFETFSFSSAFLISVSTFFKPSNSGCCLDRFLDVQQTQLPNNLNPTSLEVPQRVFRGAGDDQTRTWREVESRINSHKWSFFLMTLPSVVSSSWHSSSSSLPSSRSSFDKFGFSCAKIYSNIVS